MLSALTIGLVFHAGAQIPSSQLVFAYAGIEYLGAPKASATELELLDTRLKSYLLEIARSEDYSIVGLKDATSIRTTLLTSPQAFISYAAGNRRVSSQGIIVVRLDSQDGYKLDASMFDPSTGETLYATSKQYQNFDLLLEASREQFFQLFGLPVPIKSATAQVTPFLGHSVGKLSSVNLQDLAGKWQGDFGLGIVEIHSDGTGLAQIQDKDSMRLKITINHQTVIISQDEPNSPKLYAGSFPLSIAAEIARIARPMSWEFSVSSQKDQLIGTKYTTYLSIERGLVVQADNAYSREAVWTRIP